MSAWSDRFSGTAVAGSGGGRTFGQGGAGMPSGVGSIYHPTPAGQPASNVDAGEQPPGVVSINPLDPVGTLEQNANPIAQLLDGLKGGLFGASQPDTEGKHGGFVGDVPLLGDVLRFGSEAVANVGGTAVGRGADILGGALERTGGPNIAEGARLDEAYAALPEEFKTAYNEAINAEHGLLGTGLFDNDAHLKSEALRAYAHDQAFEKPTFRPGAFTPPGSLADTVNNLFDLLGVAEGATERMAAGVKNVQGMDRLDQAIALTQGGISTGLLGTGIAAGSPGATEVEQLAATKYQNGEWTRDEALDFLVHTAAGWSHDPGVQIAGVVFGDPLNVATFGAGAIAKVGAKGATLIARSEQAAAQLEKARAAVEAAQTAIDVAKAAKKSTKAAKLALGEAEDAAAAAQKTADAFDVYRSGGSIRKANALARGVEGSGKVATGLKFAGRAYGGLEGTMLGRSAKVTRTIIDPLHAIDLRMPGAARGVDLYSDAVPKAVVDVAGVHHYKAVMDDLFALDPSGALRDQFVNDIAVAATNHAREGIVDMYRANQIAGGLGEEVMKTLPEDVYETAIAATKQKDLTKWLRYNALKNVIVEHWDDASKNTLASQLEAIYHTRSAEEWLKAFETMNKERMSLLKYAAYGNSNRKLLNAVANSADHASAVNFPLGRMVLIAKSTLTRVGGESLLTQLTKSKSIAGRAKIIRAWQEQYPSLRYISLDEGNLGRSIDRFVTDLEDRMESLPMQVTRDELKKMHQEVQDLPSQLGDSYALGFRPEDRFLWGLERDSATGLFKPSGTAWADHVADSAMPFRPFMPARMNIVGHPIVDVPIRAALRAVDSMDSAARIMKQQVSGAMVLEAARKRFVAKAVSGELAEHGLTESVAQHWFERINEYAREHQGYSGPRGFGKGDLYGALQKEDLIPQPLLNGSRRLNPDDVMRLVLEAYDGDIRYIGLTQKLSGRAKTMIFEMTGSNWAGQIAEHVWPTLKFRYNPIFQLQEKVEPWVLNAQRGVSAATGLNMSEADRATQVLLDRMTDNSLVRQADLDMAEYSAQVLFGRKIEQTAVTPGTALQKINAMARTITEVQGMKRLNMLRTFRKGLGRDMKAAWEEAQPGVWDDMKAQADLNAGRVLDEDDFALQMVSENMFANDIIVNRLGKIAGAQYKADWANAVKTGAWHTPTTLGELKALDLDHVAGSLQLVDAKGQVIKDLAGLRQSIADGTRKVDEVVDGLKRLGAADDYTRRVSNALTFSWTGFWKTADKRFGLLPDESAALQRMMSEAANLRGMTPVEFMSQVFSPSLIDGTEGVLGYIEGPARLLREARAAGRKITARKAEYAETRTQLAGKEGVSGREDLVRQLSAAFSAHLDPSAKRALLMEFKPEVRQAVLNGTIKMDLADIQTMWDDIAESDLADRILGYMDGVPGTWGHDVVDDAARGLEDVRKGADSYMLKRGVTPRQERRYYQPDEALSEETARAYSALPVTPFERSGRRPSIQAIRKSDVELKPQPAGVDDRTYAAYQDFMVDTRAQWDHMTTPMDKGGMGIKVIVAKSDPYPDSAAMRADVAKGQLRVFAGNSDHPLMTNEQNVMFRAVHDVFGHAAEGFEFGPRGELNAAIKHSQMYSDTGRAAMLTETHGQNSWVNFSDDVVASPAQYPLPRTAREYEQEFPFEKPEGYGPGEQFAMDIYGETNYGLHQPITIVPQDKVGGGLYLMPEDVQARVFETLGSLQRQFPDYKVYHIDAPENFHVPADEGGYGMDPNINGVTWGSEESESVIFLSPESLQEPLSVQLERNLRSGHNAATGIESVMRHEFGHVVDSAIRREPFGFRVRLPENAAYWDFMDEFDNSLAREQLSTYSGTESAESAAELFNLSFHPGLDTTALPDELAAAVEDYRTILKDMGAWLDNSPAAGAGKTVREANAAKPGTVYAEQKAALLPQELLDRFHTQFVGKGKHVESNPDVARVAQMFGKWSDAVVTNGLLKGENAVHSGLLNDIAGIPTGSAVPYNYTEGAATNLAYASMARKWEDAYRLQYFAQDRTMLERTINHPMFGLYPASYMWGKIMPEVVKFLALEPFGMKTGGMLYSAVDAQAAIALRREWDAEFDAKIEDLGHSQAMSFAGYMMPTLPWDVSASAPAWMRNVAEQGLTGAKNVAAGGEAEPFNALSPAIDTIKKLNPLETTLPWAARAVGELQGPASEAEAAQQKATLDAKVQASELQPTLERTMKELQEALSR